MPTFTRTTHSRRAIELSPEIADYLLSGHRFFGGLEPPDVDTLASLWNEHQSDLIASYSPPSWCPDWPCFAEYIFDLLPRFGPRRGVDPGDPHGGYYVDERDGAEPWESYLRRCRVSR